MNYKAAEFILNFCLCLSYRFQAPGCQETCVPFLSAPAPSASRSATLSRKGCWLSGTFFLKGSLCNYFPEPRAFLQSSQFILRSVHISFFFFNFCPGACWMLCSKLLLLLLFFFLKKKKEVCSLHLTKWHTGRQKKKKNKGFLQSR